MPRYKTEIAWFSHLVWHLARKWAGLFLQPGARTGLFCTRI